MSAAVSETVRLRDRVEELERLLGMRPVLPRMWGLTGREADVLGILLRRQVMTQAQLFEAIWGGDSERSVKIVEVVVCKLRTKLRPYGIAIRTEHGVGYFVPRDSKAAARVQIAAHEQECEARAAVPSMNARASGEPRPGRAR
jgi:two-component system cell cycle response regulator CtrA